MKADKKHMNIKNREHKIFTFDYKTDGYKIQLFKINIYDSSFYTCNFTTRSLYNDSFIVYHMVNKITN